MKLKLLAVLLCLGVATPAFATHETPDYGSDTNAPPNSSYDPNFPYTHDKEPVLQASEDLDKRDREVRRDAAKTIATTAGIGALACAGMNAGAQFLGLNNKWATIGTMVIGNSLLLAANGAFNKDGVTRQLPPLAGVAGCSIGAGAVGAGSHIRNKNAEVRVAQRELLKNTREAKAAEKALRATIAARDTSLETINSKIAASPAPALVFVDTNDRELIKKVQAALNAKGYFVIKTPNGRYGPKTKEQVRKFQRDHKLPVGTLDKLTLIALGVLDKKS